MLNFTIDAYLHYTQMKIIEWFYKPRGFCPIQSEGKFMGNYFFFESRGDVAKISFSPNYYGKDLENSIDIVLKKFKNGEASWISHEYSELLIRLGFLLFNKEKYSKS